MGRVQSSAQKNGGERRGSTALLHRPVVGARAATGNSAANTVPSSRFASAPTRRVVVQSIGGIAYWDIGTGTCRPFVAGTPSGAIIDW